MGSSNTAAIKVSCFCYEVNGISAIDCRIFGRSQRQSYGFTMESRNISFPNFSTGLSTMRSLLKRLILVGLAVVAGSMASCNTREVFVPPPGPLPFNLYILQNRPVGDYYAMSGIVARVEQVKVDDSIVKKDLASFSAQFIATTGAPAVSSVLLNGHVLEQHNNDTLRLRGTSDLLLLGANNWSFTPAAGGPLDVAMGLIDPIDSVKPFGQLPVDGVLRSDSSLTIQWKRPTAASGGMYIEWRAPNDTLAWSVSDGIGTFTIDYPDMKRLTGKGLVILSRFMNISRDFNTKKLVISRVAQRSYSVSVQ